jgi:hypothetical protein
MWGKCAFRLRNRKKCGRPTVGLRDLPNQYRIGLTLQPVCELHARSVDAKAPPSMHRDSPPT